MAVFGEECCKPMLGVSHQALFITIQELYSPKECCFQTGCYGSAEAFEAMWSLSPAASFSCRFHVCILKVLECICSVLATWYFDVLL